MEKTDRTPGRGGEHRYTAPEAKVYEIAVEQGFAISGVTEYDTDDNTEGTGSDYTQTGW